MSRNRNAEDHFPDFIRLGDGQHWYRPPRSEGTVEPSPASSTRPAVEPDLIIFCSWAGAFPKHISKYLVPYQALYPRSNLLLLRSSMNNLTWVSDAVQMRNLRPAVTAINDLLQALTLEGGTGPRAAGQAAVRWPVILVHAFSNGGAHSSIQLAQAYREYMNATTPVDSRIQPHLSAELPVSALILDSSPGRADYKIGIKVVLSSIPKGAVLRRAIGMILAHAVITSVVCADKLGIAENIASKAWRFLNDLDGPFLLKKEDASSVDTEDGNALGEGLKVVPRTYVYSNRDEMVPWQGVHDHAEEARRSAAGALSEATSENGDLRDVIRLEGFAGSAHVTHATLDRERYWRLVRETVEKAL